VTHGGVHYDSTGTNQKSARKEAAFKALSDLDAGISLGIFLKITNIALFIHK